MIQKPPKFTGTVDLEDDDSAIDEAGHETHTQHGAGKQDANAAAEFADEFASDHEFPEDDALDLEAEEEKRKRNSNLITYGGGAIFFVIILTVGYFQFAPMFSGKAPVHAAAPVPKAPVRTAANDMPAVPSAGANSAGNNILPPPPAGQNLPNNQMPFSQLNGQIPANQGNGQISPNQINGQINAPLPQMPQSGAMQGQITPPPVPVQAPQMPMPSSIGAGPANTVQSNQILNQIANPNAPSSISKQGIAGAPITQSAQNSPSLPAQGQPQSQMAGQPQGQLLGATPQNINLVAKVDELANRISVLQTSVATLTAQQNASPQLQQIQNSLDALQKEIIGMPVRHGAGESTQSSFKASSPDKSAASGRPAAPSHSRHTSHDIVKAVPAGTSDGAETAVAPVAARRQAPALLESGSGGGWILRAAMPGSAMIGKPGSNDLQRVVVGDSISGLGRITSISDAGGRWVVKGTSGSIGQ